MFVPAHGKREDNCIAYQQQCKLSDVDSCPIIYPQCQNEILHGIYALQLNCRCTIILCCLRDSTLKKQCSSLHNNAFNESDYAYVSFHIHNPHDYKPNYYEQFGDRRKYGQFGDSQKYGHFGDRRNDGQFGGNYDNSHYHDDYNHYHDNFDQYNHDDNSHHHHDNSDNHDNNYRKTILVRLGHPWIKNCG
ncbi:hypothetical protein niasHS_016113 [Heterodera schachtii]|uniref:Uncharacterized protein n=1 Tax=Heterodera schachtii TaxID=97005 RepID=A0ABD2HZ11_HETSC